MRFNLIEADLIAFQAPIYQVLSVKSFKYAFLNIKEEKRESTHFTSIKDILKTIGDKL
jgi:hypothetical protein